MITTSIGGAWLAIKCLGILIGNYPNEFTLAKEIKYGRYDSIPKVFFVYLGITLVMGIAGMFYQYKLYKEKQEADNSDAGDSYKNV